MKIAVTYNDPRTAKVIQHCGAISREIYPSYNIQGIVDALVANGHEVQAIEADRFVIDRLHTFFCPLDDETWSGLVFNLAFGIQGQLRYTHLPGLLEMLGLPYLGSGPLGHSLASDKAAAKALFLHEGIPTPEFALLQRLEDINGVTLDYPLVVKPVAGASSLGLHFVDNRFDLEQAVRYNLTTFQEPVMVERFVDGREISVSIIGNQPAEALPVVEVVLGEGGLPIYTQGDKDGSDQRGFKLICPADLPAAVSDDAKTLALRAFAVLGCRDWSRVEFRLDENNQLQILELNTIPGLGAIASLSDAAKQAGMPDLASLVQRLVDVAVQRYQSRPSPNNTGPFAIKP
jgi:D-alanine-D-alanine ligase